MPTKEDLEEKSLFSNVIDIEGEKKHAAERKKILELDYAAKVLQEYLDSIKPEIKEILLPEADIFYIASETINAAQRFMNEEFAKLAPEFQQRILISWHATEENSPAAQFREKLSEQNSALKQAFMLLYQLKQFTSQLQNQTNQPTAADAAAALERHLAETFKPGSEQQSFGDQLSGLKRLFENAGFIPNPRAQSWMKCKNKAKEHKSELKAEKKETFGKKATLKHEQQKPLNKLLTKNTSKKKNAKKASNENSFLKSVFRLIPELKPDK